MRVEVCEELWGWVDDYVGYKADDLFSLNIWRLSPPKPLIRAAYGCFHYPLEKTFVV
jgi:hypothetical protein